MKIAISSSGIDLNAPMEPRFGRCPYFIIVDPETMEYEAVPNMAQGAAHGAGIQAARFIAESGVKIVITGNVGPNAFSALSSAGIEVITATLGSVREAVEKYRNGELTVGRRGPTVGGHFGGRGGGRGRGRRRPNL